MRILYIHSTFVPPPVDPQSDRFFLLSTRLEGEILQPIWASSGDAVAGLYGPGSYPSFLRGRLRYHWSLAWRYQGIRRKAALSWFYLRKGLQLHREKPIDCIVVYSHMTNALFGVVLKFLTGAKLIVEIMTSPHLVYVTESPQPSFRQRFSKLYSDFLLRVTLSCADRAHLLYPEQLARYPALQRLPASVFPDFVPVSRIVKQDVANEPYVLMVGAPWYLKGADRLITAFRRVAPEFPNVKLKILGHYPDRGPLDSLLAGSERIELLKAVSHQQALDIIAGATILALPSRCEGVPRVIVEAMAAGVPVIASDVGGIPFILHDGENGFLIPGGDPALIEKRLRELLQDPSLRQRMGSNGFQMAHTKLDEQTYVEEFARMVEQTLTPSK